MSGPALKWLPEGLPSWLKTAADAANDNIELTARQLAEKRWGQVAAETGKVVAAGGLGETFAIAAVVPAFLGTMALAAYAYLADRQYYDNKHFTPCGTEPRRAMPPHFIFAATPNFIKLMPGHDIHRGTALDPISRQAVLSYVQSAFAVPAIDKPPQGVTLPGWMAEMEESVNIAIAIADKRAEVIHHHQNGDAHLARRAEEELNELHAQAEIIAAASPLQGHRLQAMASADSGGSSTDGDLDTGDSKTDRAYREALAHALMLPDSGIRATMLTGFAGEFADHRRWPHFQAAVDQVLISANGVPDREHAMQLRIDLAQEIINKLPNNPSEMPGPETRNFLHGVVQKELAIAKRDPQYMTMLMTIQGILQGWDRVLQAQAMTHSLATLGSLATVATAGVVEAEVVDASVAPKDKTPLPVELAWQRSAEEAAGLIHIGGETKTMAEWIVGRQRWDRLINGGGLLVMGGLSVWDLGKFVIAEWLDVVRNPVFEEVAGAVGWSMAGAVIGVFSLTLVSAIAKEAEAGNVEHQARPTSLEDLPRVMHLWYRSLVQFNTNGKAGTWHNSDIRYPTRREIMAESVKVVNGKSYNLAKWMKMDPFWKPAQKDVESADLLRAIEQHGLGRVWSASELSQIRQLHIKWKQSAVQSEYFSDTVTWLAAHGNDSVVHWAHKEASLGVPKAQEAFEQLVAADNPLAIRLLADAHGNGNVKLTPRKPE